MNKDLKLKKCPSCGAIVAVLKDCNCPCGITCCEKEMVDIIINDQEASFEKHMPTYEKKDGKITIKVNHVMDEDHYIEWIGLKTENEMRIKYLNPNDIPEITWDLTENATIYSYCNKHGLWKENVQ